MSTLRGLLVTTKYKNIIVWSHAGPHPGLKYIGKLSAGDIAIIVKTTTIKKNNENADMAKILLSDGSCGWTFKDDLVSYD